MTSSQWLVSSVQILDDIRQFSDKVVVLKSLIVSARSKISLERLTSPSPSLLDPRDISRVHIPLALLGFCLPLLCSLTEDGCRLFHRSISPNAVLVGWVERVRETQRFF